MKLVAIGIMMMLLPTVALGQRASGDHRGQEFIEQLKMRSKDFNWVDLDSDVVVVGRLAAIESCWLRYGYVAPPGRSVRHARATIEPCRWIVGNKSKDVVVYYASVVYRDSAGNAHRQEIAAQPWLVPNEDMVIMASPEPMIFEGKEDPVDVYVVKAIRYIRGDCGGDGQPVYEYAGSTFDPAAVHGESGIDLAASVSVSLKKSKESLGALVASILNNR